MRHQTQDVARRVGQRRDRTVGSIRIDRIPPGIAVRVAIDESDLPIRGQPLEGGRVFGKEPPFTMPDRHGDPIDAVQERTPRVIRSPHPDPATFEVTRGVRGEPTATEQSEPEQRLKAVTDTEHRPAALDEPVQFITHRLQAVCPERTRAEMVAE